jgi:type IV secretion system protein VirD4
MMNRVKELAIKYRKPLILYGVGALIVYLVVRDQFDGYMGPPDKIMWLQIGGNLLAAAIGFALGFLPVILFTRYWPYAIAIGALIYTYFVMVPGAGAVMATPTGLVCIGFGLIAAFMRLWPAIEEYLPTTFGSSRWAKKADIEEADLITEKGLRLGEWHDPKEDVRHKLAYSGNRHLLTVAPTRAGKGVSAIIPNLLTYPGSALVIDPKGENALITAKARKAMGHEVMICDPWGIATDMLDMPAARFNPMDWLVANDPDLSENAMLLADALVMPSGAPDPFWENEARALIYGFLLYLATEPDEVDHRTLGRLRQLLTLPPPDPNDPHARKDGTLHEIIPKMRFSANEQVQAAANRIVQKAEKERSGVISTAQSHTHFLESQRILTALSRSDFSFQDLKDNKLTVYLILPADRLNTFGRWLRLMIQQAITQTARNITAKPEHPVLFLLDEMPALGHLQMVEQAYGLMAGFGMQLWGITQDLSQLKRIYGDSWETFVSNSGVLQYFGSRDQMTADYFSKLCGVTTVWNISTAVTTVIGGQNSNSETKAPGQRSLAYADELMTMRNNQQILLVENAYPIRGIKTPWFNDPELKPKGVNLHEKG